MTTTQYSEQSQTPGIFGDGVAPGSTHELLGRELFLQRAQRALKQASRSAEPCAVLLVDIDHFEDVQMRRDRRVAAGCLKILGHRVQSLLPTDQLLGRWNDNAFAICAPTVSHSNDVLDLADRIIAVCRDVVTADGNVLTVGVSVGVGRSDGGDRSLLNLLGQAERSVSQAKAQGRGRCIVGRSEADGPRGELLVEARAIIDEAVRSISRSEQRLFTLWREALRAGEEVLAAELTEASHLLRTNHRDLARRAARFDDDHESAIRNSAKWPLVGTTEAHAPGRSDEVVPRPIVSDVLLDREGNRTVMWLYGDQDHSNVDRLNERFVESVELHGREVVADLRNAGFIDGSTIGAIARASALLSAHGKCLSLRWPSAHQLRLLQAGGLDHLVTGEAPGEPRRATTIATRMGW